MGQHRRGGRLFVAAVLLGLAAAAEARGQGRSVYLNGVNVDGLVGETIEGATVRIDSLGNIHIEAPNYRVHRVVPGNVQTPGEAGGAGAAAGAGATAPGPLQAAPPIMYRLDRPPPPSLGGSPRPAVALSSGVAASPTVSVPARPPGRRVADRYFLATARSGMGDARYDLEVFLNNHFVRRIRSTEPDLLVEVTDFLRPGRNVVHFRATKDLTRPPVPGPAAAEAAISVLLGTGVEEAAGKVVLERTHVRYRRTGAETDTFDNEYEFEAR